MADFNFDKNEEAVEEEQNSDLENLLSEVSKSETVSKPRKRAPRKSNKTPKKPPAKNDPSPVDVDELLSIIGEFSALFSGAAHNGHFGGCPTATDNTKRCICNAKKGKALSVRAEKHLKKD